MPMANLASTQTGMDIVAALRKRLETTGHILSDSQYHTLMIDIMAVINTDSANATTHATSEIAAHPVRPFTKDS